MAQEGYGPHGLTADRLFRQQDEAYDSENFKIASEQYVGKPDFFGTIFEEGDRIYRMQVTDLNGTPSLAAFNKKSEEKLFATFDFVEMFGATPQFIIKKV